MNERQNPGIKPAIEPEDLLDHEGQCGARLAQVVSKQNPEVLAKSSDEVEDAFGFHGVFPVLRLFGLGDCQAHIPHHQTPSPSRYAHARFGEDHTHHVPGLPVVWSTVATTTG